MAFPCAFYVGLCDDNVKTQGEERSGLGKGTTRWRFVFGSCDARTGIGVTSAVGWSPDASRYIFGTCEGTAIVAVTPAP